MRQIKNFFSKVIMSFSIKKTPLGRWKVENMDNIIERKIYLANIDSCYYNNRLLKPRF
jgi:hypothetical protein